VERGPVVTYAYSAAAGDPSTITLDYVSPQIQDLLGVPPDEWERDPMLWFRMVHPDDRDEVLRSSRVTWRTGEPWASEYRVIRTDGGISWVADRGACVALAGSGHRRFVGGIGDVTERREDELELERTVEELRDHVAHSPAMLWTELWDPATGLSRYEYVSGNTQDLIGYTPEELAQEGEHFTRLLHPDDKERVMANVGDGSGVWTDTFRLIHRDGSVRWMQGHGQRSTPPGVAPERWHGITIDVTPHMSDSADTSESTPATNERGR